MSDIIFDGDVSVFSDIQLDFLRNILESRGFSDNKVVIEPVGKKGNNYSSIVKRIIVETSDVPFKMIAKVAPTDNFMRGVANIDYGFVNEIIMYSEVFPKFIELFEAENVPFNEQFNIPKCYTFHSSPPNEIILLEDLQTSDFVLLDKFNPFNDDSIKLVLKDLAGLHSLSYVLRERFPDMYKSAITRLVNTMEMFTQVEVMKLWILQMGEDIISVLDNNRHKTAVKETFSQLPSTVNKVCKYDRNSKHAVILQGDIWSNNLLFKVKNGEPQESIMIDYQQSRAGNPAIDFLCLTLICTDHETRLIYNHQWIDYYHLQLEKSLDNFGLRVKNIYPRDQFDADLRRYGRFGLSLAIILTNIMVRGPADVPDMENFDMHTSAEMLRVVNYSEETLLRFKTKVEGCIDSAISFGFI